MFFFKVSCPWKWYVPLAVLSMKQSQDAKRIVETVLNRRSAPNSLVSIQFLPRDTPRDVAVEAMHGDFPNFILFLVLVEVALEDSRCSSQSRKLVTSLNLSFCFPLFLICDFINIRSTANGYYGFFVLKNVARSRRRFYFTLKGSNGVFFFLSHFCYELQMSVFVFFLLSFFFGFGIGVWRLRQSFWPTLYLTVCI